MTPEEAHVVRQVADAIERNVESMQAVVGQLDRIAAQIERLMYGKALARDLRDAASQLHALIGQLREVS